MKKSSFILLFVFQIGFLFPTHSQWVMTDSLESLITHFSTSGDYLYACSAAAGIYISTDSGLSFVSSNEGLENMSTRIILPRDSMLILGTNNSMYKSIDYGANWTLASNGFPITVEQSNVTGLIFWGDSILVATYGNGIYCSVDYCDSWFPLNNGFLDLYRCGLYVNKKRIFTGTMYAGSGIYASDDGGETWVQKNNGVPMNPFDPDKYVDINDFESIGTTLFVATRGRNILKSEDNGESWSVLSCPNTYVNDLINVDDNLVCGHDGMGISESEDMGETWVYKNEGLVNPMHRVIHSLFRYGSHMIIGTHPRNIFRRPVAELITGISVLNGPARTLIYPNPVSDHLTIELNNELSDNLTISIFSIEGRLMLERQYADIQNNRLNFDLSGLSQGLYLLNIQGSEISQSFKLIKK